MSARVLVTGASGFIGRHLVTKLATAGLRVRAASRAPDGHPLPTSAEHVELGDLTDGADWKSLLDGVDWVVHLAGIAHARRTIADEVYFAVNATAVRSLAEAARATGVRRIVLVSSVKAQCGDAAPQPLTEAMEPMPTDAYGRSKLEAERVLAAELSSGVPDWVVLRPVLVYGPEVKGNMARLRQLAITGWPLPLGALTARRSLIGVGTFCDVIAHALDSPLATRRVLLTAEPGPLTVPEMITALRHGLGRAPGLWTLPPQPMRLAANLLGRGAMWERIAGGLVVDTAELEATGWRAKCTAAEGLARWIGEETQPR